MKKRNEDKENGDKGGVKSLSALKGIWTTSVELNLPDPETIAPGDIAKKAEIIDVGQAKVQEWTKNLLTKIGQRTTAVGEIESPSQKKIAKKLADDANAADLKALVLTCEGRIKISSIVKRPGLQLWKTLSRKTLQRRKN